MNITKKSINKSLALITMLSCMACSTYRKPESFEAKMTRFKASGIGKNIVPQFGPIEVSYKPAKKVRGRTPASVGGQNVSSSSHSNKRLYFLTLFTQYNELRSYSKNSSPEINICPNFHSSLVTHKESFGSKKIVKKSIPYEYAKLSDIEKVSSIKHPILGLPVTRESAVPTVFDVINKNSKRETGKIVQAAMDLHIEKTYNELSALCEYGVSDNYYTYENLVTFTKSERIKLDPSIDNARTLLKTSIFANEALIDSLKSAQKAKSGRTIASVDAIGENPYFTEAASRIGAGWSEQYFKGYGK